MDQLTSGYAPVIDEICGLNWAALDTIELSAVAWAYYYFSIQFRENLEVMLSRYADDPQVQNLVREECATDNLSPWPDVAAPEEKLNHDEFMRRVLQLSPIDHDLQTSVQAAGAHYLTQTRQMDVCIKVMSIASYECGGLESVFKAILAAKHWDTPLLIGFRHFLLKHISFDSDPGEGHGAMIQHYRPDDQVRLAWVQFRDLLVTAVPRLVS